MISPLVVITYITYKKENELFQTQMSQYLLQTVAQTQRALDANLSEIDRLTWTLLYEQSLDFINGPLDSPYRLFDANQKFKSMVYSNLFRGRLEHIRAIYFVTSSKDVLSTENLFYSFEQVNRVNYQFMTDQLEKQPLKMSWFSDNAIFVLNPTSLSTNFFRFLIAIQSNWIYSRVKIKRFHFWVILLKRFNKGFLSILKYA